MVISVQSDVFIMKILVYESITANYKNAQNSISEETYNDYKSLLKSGEDMRTQLILDLKKNPKIKILIGNHMAGEDQTSYLQRIKSKIDAAWVIAPESNGELMHCFSILKNKIWIGSSYEAIKITSSKKLTKEILKQSLIKFPKTLKPHQIHFKSDNYIVKPDDGAGSSETFKLKNITNINDLKFFYMMDTNFNGIPVSISRTGYTGDLGYEIWINKEDALTIWDLLLDKGKNLNHLKVEGFSQHSRKF